MTSGRTAPASAAATASTAERLARTGPGSGTGVQVAPGPGALEHVDGHLEVHGPGTAGGEALEEAGEHLGDLIGTLDAHAASAHRVHGGLLVLHLVEPATVGAHRAARRPG